MKKLCLIIFLFPLTVYSSSISDIEKSLAPWAVISSDVSNGQLVVVTNENRVTDTIYSSIIKKGICSIVWFKRPNALKGITEVSVVNKFGRQGYVFEGGKRICEEMGKITTDEIDFYLMGHTRLH